MSPSQRAAAERLIAEHPTLFMNDLPDWCDDAFHLLRELAAEPVVNQQMTTEPVQEPGVEYKRGYEEALNDCIRNGGEEWARSMFANNAEHIKPVQTPVVLDLLEQSRQNCLRNFGPNGLADWIYKDLGELLADAAPQQRKPLTDDEALALIRATPQEDVTQEGWIRRQRLSWVRAIERAITGEPT